VGREPSLHVIYTLTTEEKAQENLVLITAIMNWLLFFSYAKHSYNRY